MWDNVTEIKCNNFGWVWLLKNLFFSNVYISVNTILWMLLFVHWLRNRPSIKYLRNWGNGGRIIQIAYTCVQGEGSLKIDHKILNTYVLNGWPQKHFVEYFLCIGWANYTRASPPARKMSLIIAQKCSS